MRLIPSGRLHDLAPKILSFSAVLCWVLSAGPAYPWGTKGHEIIAAIAETQLTDAARKRIKELLPQGTTLADASTWPDKAGRQIPDMDPITSSTSPKTQTPTTSSATANSETASLKLSRGMCRC
jgi:S1/P1 Nuclease